MMALDLDSIAGSRVTDGSCVDAVSEENMLLAFRYVTVKAKMESVKCFALMWYEAKKTEWI